jgi:hypothetical protein
MTIQCNIKVPKHNYSKIRGSLHSGMPTVQLSRIVLRYSRCLIVCVKSKSIHFDRISNVSFEQYAATGLMCLQATTALC